MKMIDFKTFPVVLSEKATQVIEQALRNPARINKILRISIEGGGCKGFKYNLNFVHADQLDVNDIVCNYNKNIVIVLDPNSYTCLKNTVVDFVTISKNSGFVFNSPVSDASCIGCD